jgi:hypothetical protein
MAAAPGTQYSGLANLMAMQGTGGDNTLVHMSKAELPYLNTLARAAGHTNGLPINPKTGLPEANILKSILPIAGGIIGSMVLPGIGGPLFAGAIGSGLGAGLGTFGGNLLAGKSLKDAAIGGLMSGGLAGLGAATFGGQELFGPALTTGASNLGTATANQAVGAAVKAPGVVSPAASNLPVADYSDFANLSQLPVARQVVPTQAIPVAKNLPGFNINYNDATTSSLKRIAGLPEKAGWLDMGAVYGGIPKGVPTGEYLKYAAKPIATQVGLGIGKDMLTGQGAFAPPKYQEPEVPERRTIPLRGLRFDSTRRGFFPRTEEEALAFAQPGGVRERFFDQSFTVPAKTGGGIAALAFNEGGDFTGEHGLESGKGSMVSRGPGAFVEDMSKAVVDALVPGWAKAGYAALTSQNPVETAMQAAKSAINPQNIGLTAISQLATNPVSPLPHPATAFMNAMMSATPEAAEFAEDIATAQNAMAIESAIAGANVPQNVGAYYPGRMGAYQTAFDFPPGQEGFDLASASLAASQKAGLNPLFQEDEDFNLMAAKAPTLANIPNPASLAAETGAIAPPSVPGFDIGFAEPLGAPTGFDIGAELGMVSPVGTPVDISMDVTGAPALASLSAPAFSAPPTASPTATLGKDPMDIDISFPDPLAMESEAEVGMGSATISGPTSGMPAGASMASLGMPEAADFEGIAPSAPSSVETGLGTLGALGDLGSGAPAAQTAAQAALEAATQQELDVNPVQAIATIAEQAGQTSTSKGAINPAMSALVGFDVTPAEFSEIQENEARAGFGRGWDPKGPPNRIGWGPEPEIDLDMAFSQMDIESGATGHGTGSGAGSGGAGAGAGAGGPGGGPGEGGPGSGPDDADPEGGGDYAVGGRVGDIITMERGGPVEMGFGGSIREVIQGGLLSPMLQQAAEGGLDSLPEFFQNNELAKALGLKIVGGSGGGGGAAPAPTPMPTPNIEEETAGGLSITPPELQEMQDINELNQILAGVPVARKRGGPVEMGLGGWVGDVLEGGLLSPIMKQIGEDGLASLPEFLQNNPVFSGLGFKMLTGFGEGAGGGGGAAPAPTPTPMPETTGTAEGLPPELQEIQDINELNQVLAGVPVARKGGGLISSYAMGGPPSPYFEGRVTGRGDGMSDSIPFSIENQQPAILSRDEYVLPADIVSMMGNGSSDAGSEKIDSFINDFRVQKYGRGQQPPETSRGLRSIV